MAPPGVASGYWSYDYTVADLALFERRSILGCTSRETCTGGNTCAVLRALVKRLLSGPRDPAADVLLVVAGRYFDQASVDEIGPGPE